MAITKTVTLYTFDELTDKAKERARDWWRSCMEPSDYADSVIEDAEQCAKIMGIVFDHRTYKTMGGGTGTEPRVSWELFCQGGGASFEGSYRYAKRAAKLIRAHAPHDKELHAIADSLQAAQRQFFYRLKARCSTSGNYSHSGCMRVEVWDSEDDCRDIGNADDKVRDALRDFADWIYRGIEKEYEYQSSDEQIDETIETNEYTFTADGKRED